jgi:hypothetical protein
MGRIGVLSGVTFVGLISAANLDKIAADVRAGGRRDVILYAVGANAAHGLKRTNRDKRNAVMVLLKDPEWSGWSDSEISRRCAVTQPFVSKLRASLITVISEPPAARTYTTKHGTTSTMTVSNIGARPAPASAPAGSAGWGRREAAGGYRRLRAGCILLFC